MVEVDFVERVITIDECRCLDFSIVVSLVKSIVNVLFVKYAVEEDLVIEELLIEYIENLFVVFLFLPCNNFFTFF